MARRLERPILKLKFELEVPDQDGALPKKYVVSRFLKARWGDNPQVITQQILDEIKNYRGSYVGDIVQFLHSLSNSKENLADKEVLRSNDVTKWISQTLDSVLFSGINDDDFDLMLDNQSISEQDGTLKKVGPIEEEDVKNVNLEKVMLLLEPRIKHAIFLLSKKIKNKS